MCLKISKEVAPEIAVLAEPLSCVIHGSERVNVQPGDSVVIVGGGSNGAVVYTGIKSCGCSKKIICVDFFSDYRLDYSKKSLELLILLIQRTKIS
ncbi:hypothetical protein GCM10020331_097180 [Ectobacillus funiculus]